MVRKVMDEPSAARVTTQLLDHSGDAWMPSRRGHPGFVNSRLLTTSAVILLSDWLALILAFVAVSRLRFGANWSMVWDIAVPDWRIAVPICVTASLTAGSLLGFYEVRPMSWRRDLIRTGSAVGILALTTLALLFMFDRDDVSRLFLVVYFPIAWLAIATMRGIARTWLRKRRKAGKGIINVLVVGSGAVAVGFITEATAHAEAGVNVIGFLDTVDRDLPGYPRLGSVDDVAVVLKNHVVDEVVVCLPLDDWGRIGQIATTLESQGKSIRIPIHVPGTSHANSRIGHLAGVPVLSVVPTPDQPLANACKRLLDVVVAGGALLILAPLMAIIATTIALTDGRPVLFSQPRAGLHGRMFILRKFRTMVSDAETRLVEVAGMNERSGPVFKATRDPRMTKFGKILRVTSLDELPQFWNVLRGEMSLVGPRPPLSSEVEQYDNWHRRRLSMKPGMTGLWQVSNRNETNFDNWVALDLQYIDSWSISMDLRILARTIPAVIRLTGK
jgi:exopolysaccharide biosynthesis polyprenyl glycosylphosphotransferase